MPRSNPSNLEDGTALDNDFTFDSGHLCLDCLATISDRRGAALERWKSGHDLAVWCRKAGLLAAEIPVPPEMLRRARDFREALYRLISALRAGAKPPPRTIRTINDWAARPTAAPRLSNDGREVSRHAVSPLEAAMATIARDALDMIASRDMGKVRECQGPACSMLFIDDSRPANRRWCSMKRCGNRSKKAAYRKRTSRRGK